MDIITLVSIMAAIATVTASIYGIYKKLSKSWHFLQRKVDNLEKSLEVNQRGIINSNIVAPKDSTTLINIPKDTEVTIIGINDANIATITCFDGLLTTKVHISNIDVE